MFGKHFAELGHHIFKGPFMACDGSGFGELIVHPKLIKTFFQLGHQNVTQRHSSGTNFSTNYLESTGNLRCRIADTRVVQFFQQRGVCGKTGDHRHQMRLTCAVVTNNQQALVIDRHIELQLRNDKMDEPFSHFLRNNIGAHECMCGTRFVRVTQLNNRLDRIELDKVSVFHIYSASLLFFYRIQCRRTIHAHNKRIDRVIVAVLRMTVFGVQQPPRCYDSIP